MGGISSKHHSNCKKFSAVKEKDGLEIINAEGFEHNFDSSATRRIHIGNYFTLSSSLNNIEFVHGKGSPSKDGITSPDQCLSLRPDLFDFGTALGRGAFGAVFKVRRKSTGKEYAMKVQPIESLCRSSRSFRHKVVDETLVHMERTVLASCSGHPFITNLEYAFYTDKYAILILEYSPGTLCGLIANSPKKRLQFSLGKLYAMELVTALNFMHQKGIMYRDLKPSNVLISLKGHLKLTDFGLAGSILVSNKRASLGVGLMDIIYKQADSTTEKSTESEIEGDDSSTSTYPSATNQQTCVIQRIKRRTICGTAGYRPPEQVSQRFLDYFSRRGYDERADWFSLGVCCYTMLTGQRPFPNKKEYNKSNPRHRQTIDSRALHANVGKAYLERMTKDPEYQCLMIKVRYPDHFMDEPDAKCFIEKLLARDPDQRPDYDGIISHSWMTKETFDAEKIKSYIVPDRVLQYAHEQLLKADKASHTFPRCRKTLSRCIDFMCSDCHDNHSSGFAENFSMKWKTKASEHSISRFKYWNYISDTAYKLENNIEKKQRRRIFQKQ